MANMDDDKDCSWENCDREASAKIAYALPAEIVHYCKEHFEQAKQVADDGNVVRKVEY